MCDSALQGGGKQARGAAQKRFGTLVSILCNCDAVRHTKLTLGNLRRPLGSGSVAD